MHGLSLKGESIPTESYFQFTYEVCYLKELCLESFCRKKEPFDKTNVSQLIGFCKQGFPNPRFPWRGTQSPLGSKALQLTLFWGFINNSVGWTDCLFWRLSVRREKEERLKESRQKQAPTWCGGSRYNPRQVGTLLLSKYCWVQCRWCRETQGFTRVITNYKISELGWVLYSNSKEDRLAVSTSTL